jgi:hypothetical protein
VRLIPWDHLITMLECFPMESSFLKDFRTLCPPDKIRIVAFVAPTFLSYDSQDISQPHLSTQLPTPIWTFSEDSEVPTPVRDLITKTMPFFEPLVTTYKTSSGVDPEDKTRFSKFDADAWEWIIKRVIDQGWYSSDGRVWREFVDKIACKECRGDESIPGEIKSGLSYMAKVDSSAKRTHSC